MGRRLTCEAQAQHSGRSAAVRGLSKYLESQVAQNHRQLFTKVAHNSLKVAQNYGPLAFQVAAFVTRIQVSIPDLLGARLLSKLEAKGIVTGDTPGVLRGPRCSHYLERQWLIIKGYFQSIMVCLGVVAYHCGLIPHLSRTTRIHRRQERDKPEQGRALTPLRGSSVDLISPVGILYNLS